MRKSSGGLKKFLLAVCFSILAFSVFQSIARPIFSYSLIVYPNLPVLLTEDSLSTPSSLMRLFSTGKSSDSFSRRGKVRPLSTPIAILIYVVASEEKLARKSETSLHKPTSPKNQHADSFSHV